MAPTAPELVHAAMKACKVTTPTELARAMGYGPWSAQKIKRWLNEENKPKYDETMALLETAGWLRAGAGGAAPASRRAAGTPADPLGLLAESVAELAATQALIADALGVPRAGAEPAEAPQSRRRAAPNKE